MMAGTPTAGTRRTNSVLLRTLQPLLAIMCGFALPLLGLAVPRGPAASWSLVRALGAGAPIRQIARAGGWPHPTLYVVAAGWGVYASEDGSQSWRPLGALPRGDLGRVECSGLAVSDVPNLLLLTQQARQPTLLKSTDGGESWVARRGLQGLAIDAIAFAGGTQAYAMAGGSLYRSDDGGDTWLLTGRSPTQGSILAMAAGTSPPRLCLAASDGLWMTQDGGDWALTWQGSAMDSLVSSKGQVLYAGGPAGLCRSDDGGATWQAEPLPREGQGLRALAVADDSLGVALSDGSVWLRAGRDADWQPLPALPAGLAVTALAVWLDPAPALLAGSATGLWRLPLPARGG